MTLLSVHNLSLTLSKLDVCNLDILKSRLAPEKGKKAKMVLRIFSELDFSLYYIDQLRNRLRFFGSSSLSDWNSVHFWSERTVNAKPRRFRSCPTLENGRNSPTRSTLKSKHIIEKRSSSEIAVTPMEMCPTLKFPHSFPICGWNDTVNE